MENAPAGPIGPPPPLTPFPFSAPTSPPLPPPPPLTPFPFSSPPLPVNQITILTAPPPPPLPPFPDSPSSVDLSPLEFLLALVAVVTIPALIYTFIFAVKCPSRRQRTDEASEGAPSAVSETPRDADSVAVSDVKYRKDSHVKEIGIECPVCLSVFGDGDDVRQLSVCKHSFHASCIDLWLSNHSNCPICRANVPGKPPTTSAPGRDSDLQQGLPDASALV